jgi:DNA modification methylase
LGFPAPLTRVLKPTGVFWLNVADTVLDNELLLVPYRLAIALTDNGWTCRQEVIWHVPNRAPEGTTNRPYRNHEHVLMFVKQKDHYFDMAGIRESAVSGVKPGKEFPSAVRTSSKGLRELGTGCAPAF